MHESFRKRYEKLLANYLRDRKEEQLYAVQQLSKWMIEHRIPPDEIVGYHALAIRKMIPDASQEVRDSLSFLIETMVTYGIAYQEHENLVNRQQELENEIDVAVGMQQSLLPQSVPSCPGLEVGVVSVPAKRMSGDYYNFTDHGDGSFGIALSDIIGSGIPAALCMSMIKYAMDGLDDHLSPAETLRRLNSVVERNVDNSMFITMVYGVYNTETHQFRYAAAGHEPGFIYRSDEGKFYDMEAKGLVLGVSRDIRYPEYNFSLASGDAIILFSDGVTESRVNGKFLEREEFAELIRKHLDQSAQKAVNAISQDLHELANYELHDDQTILLVRRL